MPRYLFSAVFACIAAACGSEERGLTQPSPQSGPLAVVLVHNTLNPPDNRASRSLMHSYLRPYSFPFADPRAYDDFTSAVTTTIRTVSWQGGYCSGGVTPPPGTRPQPPPTAASSSFQLAFYPDDNGRPAWFRRALSEVTLMPAEAHEQFTFDSGSTADGCAWQAPTATYYDYTAVLPMPFPVTAGTRYWLLLRADTGNTGIAWGWRIGMQDNNYSAFQVQGLQTSQVDLAFSLSDQ